MEMVGGGLGGAWCDVPKSKVQALEDLPIPLGLAIANA